MPRTYLPKFYHLITGIILFFCWILGFYILMFLFFLIYISAFFLLRKDYKSFKENPSIKKGVLFSPLNGKVISVRKDVEHIFFGKKLIEVRIKVPWWKENGIYLPLTSEVEKVEVTKGKTFFRLGREILPDQKEKMFSGLSLALKAVNGDHFGLQFIKCNTDFWPETPVMPGDRGKRQVNIGYFPLGGTVLLYLPGNYEILVNEKDDVLAGETLVGGSPA